MPRGARGPVFLGTFGIQGRKLARVAPIFKIGVELDMSNCVLISFFSTVIKVFEKIVYEQLYDYFEKNRFVTKYQPGFRRLHSTVTASGWLLNMDKGYYEGVILFDLKRHLFPLTTGF